MKKNIVFIAILSKMIDMVIPIIIGILSYSYIEQLGVNTSKVLIYDWIYIIYGLIVIVFLLFTKKKTLGLVLLRKNVIDTNNKNMVKLFVLKEIVFMIMLNLIFYEFGFLLLGLLVPVKISEGNFVTFVDLIFGIKYLDYSNN